MNLPNKLTLTRIVLVPVFMIFVSMSQYFTPDYNPRWYLIAGIIFAVASCSATSAFSTSLSDMPKIIFIIAALN